MVIKLTRVVGLQSFVRLLYYVMVKQYFTIEYVWQLLNMILAAPTQCFGSVFIEPGS